MTSEFDFRVRYQVYRFFAETGRAPTFADIAETLQADPESVRASFHALHEHHMIFLEPGSDAIRMANPFSAIPTRYRVRSGPKAWWANCAWDTLGIAAALNADVRIEAGYPDSPARVELVVENGRVDGKGHVVYFALPFRRWYDDLVFT